MTIYQIVSIWIIIAITMYFYLLSDKSRFEGKCLFISLIGAPLLLLIFLIGIIFNIRRER
jgi:hypothetical protein